MNPQISGGALAIYRHMLKNKLKINRDPSKDIAWLYVPTEVARKAHRTGVEDVDAPAAKFCLELINRGLIRRDSGSLERKSGTYMISEESKMLAHENSH